tara:strand:+ start:137 stop:412 length:276 start_codon:yes stop_codon:yes gene_type:complete
MAILGTQDITKLKTASGLTPTLDKQKDSKLHDEYSIIGRPSIENKPVPSSLDTDGIPKFTSDLSGGEKLDKTTSILDQDITPTKYTDNLPS